MSERKWKRFEGVATRIVRDAIRASVTPLGEFTFDIDTYRKMGEPQAVFLLYESETRTVGIEPANADAPNAVLVRPRHKASNRLVRSMPFCKENGIDVSRTMRLPFAYLEGKTLILDLRTAVVLGKGWRKLEHRAARKAANAEIRVERERHREERLREKEELKAERQRLSAARMEVAKRERELERREKEREREMARARREFERRFPAEAATLKAENEARGN